MQPAEPRATPRQSALKRSERSLPGHWRPLTGNEQRQSVQRPPYERRRRLQEREEGEEEEAGQVGVVRAGEERLLSTWFLAT